MSDELKGKRILIVDDEPDILETIEELLDFCVIDKAPNFESARRFIDKATYDAAILDIMGVRGYELLDLARERRIPVLMLTAHALSPESLVRSLQGGAEAYIPKDKMGEIALYLADVIREQEKRETPHPRWFARLKPYFDRKFGEGWREKDLEFWKSFDRDSQVSKEELEDLIR
jgi:DNA-binding response OmpR family regulator